MCARTLCIILFGGLIETYFSIEMEDRMGRPIERCRGYLNIKFSMAGALNIKPIVIGKPLS